MSADVGTPELFIPRDVREAQFDWCASCAPVAFAAACSRPVMSVKSCFPTHERKPWASSKQIEEALLMAVAEFWIERFDAIGQGQPNYGLMCVTCPDEVKPMFDHTVAVAEGFIFDVNFPSAWLPVAEWERIVLPLLNSFTSSNWRVTDAWEITHR